MAGRPPVPTALKLLKGTQKKCRVLGEEPRSPAGATCPPSLQGQARELWDQWAPVFETMGCLRQVDAMSFAAWMDVEADMIAMRAAGEPISANLRRTALNYAIQFGGTPSARARIHVEPKKPESKMEKFRARA